MVVGSSLCSALFLFFLYLSISLSSHLISCLFCLGLRWRSLTLESTLRSPRTVYRLLVCAYMRYIHTHTHTHTTSTTTNLFTPKNIMCHIKAENLRHQLNLATEEYLSSNMEILSKERVVQQLQDIFLLVVFCFKPLFIIVVLCNYYGDVATRPGSSARTIQMVSQRFCRSCRRQQRARRKQWYGWVTTHNTFSFCSPLTLVNVVWCFVANNKGTSGDLSNSKGETATRGGANSLLRHAVLPFLSGAQKKSLLALINDGNFEVKFVYRWTPSPKPFRQLWAPHTHTPPHTTYRTPIGWPPKRRKEHQWAAHWISCLSLSLSLFFRPS